MRTAKANISLYFPEFDQGLRVRLQNLWIVQNVSIYSKDVRFCVFAG